MPYSSLVYFSQTQHIKHILFCGLEVFLEAQFLLNYHDIAKVSTESVNIVDKSVKDFFKREILYLSNCVSVCCSEGQ